MPSCHRSRYPSVPGRRRGAPMKAERHAVHSPAQRRSGPATATRLGRADGVYTTLCVQCKGLSGQFTYDITYESAGPGRKPPAAGLGVSVIASAAWQSRCGRGAVAATASRLPRRKRLAMTSRVRVSCGLSGLGSKCHCQRSAAIPSSGPNFSFTWMDRMDRMPTTLALHSAHGAVQNAGLFQQSIKSCSSCSSM